MTSRSSKCRLPSVLATNSMRLTFWPSPSISCRARRKAPTRNRVARQSAMFPTLSTNQREDFLHLIEGPDRHQQSAKRQVSGKIGGSRHNDRRHQHEPAIASGDPGQCRSVRTIWRGMTQARSRCSSAFRRRFSPASPRSTADAFAMLDWREPERNRRSNSRA